MSTANWTARYVGAEMKYPAEYVVRIFKGAYPNLSLSLDPDATVLDAGCGDGRHLAFLNAEGYRAWGFEVTDEIAAAAMAASGCTVHTGTNATIPFNASAFDAALAWNTVYYMDDAPMAAHVEELARVLKPGGTLILSVPKPSCFIYKDCEPLDDGLVRITSDPFGIRNGDVLYRFVDPDHIRYVFGSHFEDFTFADIHDDCFGWAYHWNLCVCRRPG